MKKVVYNDYPYGSFGINIDMLEEIVKLKGVDYTIQHSYTEPIFVTSDGKVYSESYFNSHRDDVELVMAIEKFGSEYVSDTYASFCITEYDETNYDYYIQLDSEEREYVTLIPVVTEQRLKECSSTEEILNYLNSLGIKTRREK